MNNDELKKKLDDIQADIGRIKKDVSDVSGSGTAFMVFCMFWVFVLNGCNFK